jgi:hypothetical protein
MIGVGLVVLAWFALGILLIVFRKPVARFSSDAQRALFGRLGRSIANQTTPWTYGVVGIGAVVIGLLVLVLWIARQLA